MKTIDEVLHEKSIEIEPQLGVKERYFYRVVHGPEKVEKYKSKLPEIPGYGSTYNKAFPQFSEYANDKEKFIRVDMTENRTIAPGEKPKILITAGIADCVGIAVFDASATKFDDLKEKREMAGLFHFSKMDSDKDLESFLKKFNPATAVVHLISIYYSPELIRTISYLQKEKFTIQGLNIYDAYFDNNANSSITYLDKNKIPESSLAIFKEGGGPRTGFLLDAATGSVGFDIVMPKITQKRKASP